MGVSGWGRLGWGCCALPRSSLWLLLGYAGSNVKWSVELTNNIMICIHISYMPIYIPIMC